MCDGSFYDSITFTLKNPDSFLCSMTVEFVNQLQGRHYGGKEMLL
jgi:hypothetical protein